MNIFVFLSMSILMGAAYIYISVRGELQRQKARQESRLKIHGSRMESY